MKAHTGHIHSWIYRRLAAGAVILFGALTAFAQHDTVPVGTLNPEAVRLAAQIDATHIITEAGATVRADSVIRRLNTFYMDQYRHFQDPRAPYFMFMSKDGKLAMGIGGLIRMRGYFDWNGSIPANGFAPYLIQIPKDPTQLRKLAATPAGCGLFFTVLGTNSVIGDYMGFIQAEFSGYNNRDFKLKKAYIQTDHLTVGYATTTFEDTQAEPATIDGSGPNGENGKTNVLVRYTTKLNKHWSVAAGLEFPESSQAADGVYTKACNDWLPDVAAWIQYRWNNDASHIRLSGLGRTLTYRDMIGDKNHNIIGWAAQLSSVIKVIPQLNLFGIASIGQGHSSYTTDLACGSFDLIPRQGENGRLYAPTAVGYVFGAQYYFTPNIFCNMALSQQRYYPKENPQDSQYKYGLYGAWNIFWDITPRFEVGAEYLAGKRMNFNGTHGNANRITAMMMFSF